MLYTILYAIFSFVGALVVISFFYVLFSRGLPTFHGYFHDHFFHDYYRGYGYHRRGSITHLGDFQLADATVESIFVTGDADIKTTHVHSRIQIVGDATLEQVTARRLRVTGDATITACTIEKISTIGDATIRTTTAASVSMTGDCTLSDSQIGRLSLMGDTTFTNVTILGHADILGNATFDQSTINTLDATANTLVAVNSNIRIITMERIGSSVLRRLFMANEHQTVVLRGTSHVDSIIFERHGGTVELHDSATVDHVIGGTIVRN